MKREALIEKYIQNRLSVEEQLLFDEFIKNDSQLKKVVINADDSNFKKLITEIESRSKPANRKTSYAKWLVAASIVVLLGSFYFIYFNDKNSSNELFAEYFEPYRNVIQPIERNNEQHNKKTQAFAVYENGDYNKAIILFSRLYETTNESYYLFYKANALLQLDRADEAIALLIKHHKTNGVLTQKTNWYLALAYLKIDDKINTEKVLQKVIASKMYKTKEAEELIEKLH